jgi:hypothetical protein
MNLDPFLPFLDKQGLPLALSLVIAAAFLALLFSLVFIHKNYNPTTMHKSKIIRTVTGDPADPSSTRSLTRITCEEFEHIRLAVLSGQLEAATFSAMDDGQLASALEHNRKACASIGCELPPLGNPDCNALREFFCERWESCAIFIANMDGRRGRKVKGISPTEFMHLVASIQAACREAQLCLGFTNDQVKHAFSLCSMVRVGLGQPIVHPYQAHEADYHAFFTRRLEVLLAILHRINQPYPGLEYGGAEGLVP